MVVQNLAGTKQFRRTELRLFFLAVILIISLSFIRDQEILPKKINKIPAGYWMSKKKNYGYLFTKSGYWFEYYRWKYQRIGDEYIADDVVPHLNGYKYEIKNDTIGGCIKILSIKSDTLVLNRFIEGFIDTLVPSKDQVTPVYVKVINRYVNKNL